MFLSKQNGKYTKHKIYMLYLLDSKGNFGFLLTLHRWYAKRFLHPDIVAPYDYIFIWDEDLGVENFDAEE